MDDNLTYNTESIGNTEGILSINNPLNDEDNNNNIEFDGTTFSELSSKISDSNNGDTIILTNNISQDGNSEILIDKSVIIIGNGNIIDAKHVSRIFNITAGNVVLKDIILYNGNTTGFGGSIHWSGADGLIENCSFFGNDVL